MQIEIQTISEFSHVINVNVHTTLDEILVFPISDVHFDSVQCNRKLLKSHLNEAKEQNGIIIIAGDLFDMMQGTFDPRRSYTDIRPEYKDQNYIDAVIEDAASFFAPYAKNLALVGYGNHENKVLKNNNTDPIKRFVKEMNSKGSPVVVGSYFGFIRLVFNRVIEKSKEKNWFGTSIIAYHHGHGGNAKRSKGVLDHQLDGFQYPDADIIIKGHNHHKIHDPGNTRWRISYKGSVYEHSQTFLRLGTYKLTKHGNGFEIEKGFFPSPQGSWRIYYRLSEPMQDGKRSKTHMFEVREAK